MAKYSVGGTENDTKQDETGESMTRQEALALISERLDELERAAGIEPDEDPSAYSAGYGAVSDD